LTNFVDRYIDDLDESDEAAEDLELDDIINQDFTGFIETILKSGPLFSGANNAKHPHNGAPEQEQSKTGPAPNKEAPVFHAKDKNAAGSETAKAKGSDK